MPPSSFVKNGSQKRNADRQDQDCFSAFRENNPYQKITKDIEMYKKVRLAHKKFIGFYEKVEIVLSVSILCSIVLINGCEIFFRYILNNSIYWAQEITLIGAMWMVFLGAGVLFKRKQYIVVSFFMKFFKARSQFWIYQIINFLMLIFFVILIISSITLEVQQSNFRSMGLQIPSNFFIMPISVGSLSIFITILDDFLSTLEDNEIPNEPTKEM